MFNAKALKEVHKKAKPPEGGFATHTVAWAGYVA
jgi:hypothetical protein